MTATDFRPQTELYERRPVTAPKRLLVVYAHPDDEAFGNAGIILAARAAGVEVQYVCATRGECGTVDEHFLADHADVRALRTAEQLAAAEALDLGAVHFLNYRDSNMPGTPDNLHPEALVMAPVLWLASSVSVGTMLGGMVIVFLFSAAAVWRIYSANRLALTIAACI